MAIFGRKRVKKVKKEFVPPVDVKEISEMRFNQNQAGQKPMAKEHIPQKTEYAERPFAPVFIKLTRYRQVLNTMNYLKMNINLIRNQIAVLDELDKLRDENLKLLKSALEKVSDRLIKLDSSFMRPSGYMDEMSDMQAQEAASLDATISDLRTQIENLKSEVESVA
jgi:archaellum component FlaC